MDSAAHNPEPRPLPRIPGDCVPFVRGLFAECPAERWQLSFAAFESALVRSASKRFTAGSPSVGQLQAYFSTLHLRDLALACACAEGLQHAWEDFVAEYRPYLRTAAAVILRRSPTDPAAIELADSLFTDLYGISDRDIGARSLFRYFHGRSSLKTWLRAVLAQRHIDLIRSGKKFESLDDQPADGEPRRVREPATVELPADPRREQYLQRFREALTSALASLDARDRARLQLYYAEDRTLAEIGRAIGEHESSVSRNLERVRKELRATVEGLLRAGSTPVNGGSVPAGLDDPQIALCIQYAAEGAAIDLDKLFDVPTSQNSPGPNRPGIDRKLKP
jgi:RNA polymerase sigma-70 factor (ECF subfamily)